MKTIVSIPLIILLLFTGIKVSVATHYCCGHVAATKVSLTGEQASCGMQNEEDTRSSQDIFATHCCDNITSSCSFSNNYFPSLYSFDNFEVKSVDLFRLASDVVPNQELLASDSDNEGRPPGSLLPNDVLLSSICVFRI
jgi:hypothetical protein